MWLRKRKKKRKDGEDEEDCQHTTLLRARSLNHCRVIVTAEHFAHTFRKQADKLQSLISAAKVPEIEPIWTTLFAKALEGKDVKDLLLNVGSGGGAAPAAGGAANEIGRELTEAFTPMRERLESAELDDAMRSDSIDVTLPGR